jgi:mannose-6-phosphate isomerase-like protein (cupin superfamily)
MPEVIRIATHKIAIRQGGYIMIKNVSEGKNHTAINIGRLDNLSEHSFLHPKLGHTVERKLFVGEILKATGSEISFTELPARTTISFLHKHRKNEEIYIILKGSGLYQVDDVVFEIQEGSFIRVSPDGARTLKNNSDENMVYMVIQSGSGTLEGYDISDGYRVDGQIKLG